MAGKQRARLRRRVRRLRSPTGQRRGLLEGRGLPGNDRRGGRSVPEVAVGAGKDRAMVHEGLRPELGTDLR